MATLERKILHSCNSELQELAEKSRQVLGYTVLQNSIKDAPLARTLRELGIEPFTYESVRKYQQEMADEQNKGRRWWNKLPFLYKRKWIWQRETLRYTYGPRVFCEYRLPIPEFVLAKAVQIAEKLPEVRLQIETLSDDILYADPFLIANLDYTEEFYIEVWDEPKFEGKL